MKKLGIHYTFRKLEKLEGVLLPYTDDTGTNLIAINSRRTIQRMRYSCVHELCHFLKDTGNPEFDPMKCIPGAKSQIERFAESFAASFLMPRDEIKKAVSDRIRKCYLSLDDVLYIADFFGASFSACIVRVKQVIPEALPDVN
ncbi:MAG: ImmA/IrrE family metallo-endopeptidase [Spirochaetales bacterium]|nr:ImmA/IrrE family metallo-endopeptidase [Spirochaetales bacterium]